MEPSSAGYYWKRAIRLFLNSLFLLCLSTPLMNLQAGERNALPSFPDTEPLIVAHRGGTADEPENTLLSIRTALRNKANMIEISVQLTQDKIPVLYRPLDLASLTQGKGKVADKKLKYLKTLNAGYHFCIIQNGKPSYPYRESTVLIPTLEETLQAIPKKIPIILDLKSLPAAPLVDAIAKVLTQENAWHRVYFYSTLIEHFQALAHYPQAQCFEPRDITRTRLVKSLFLQQCETPPSANTWVGIELDRALTVSEKFTLGQGDSPLSLVRLWNAKAISCFQKQGAVKIFLFGIDTPEAYQTAKILGAYAVMTDSPKKLQQWIHG